MNDNKTGWQVVCDAYRYPTIYKTPEQADHKKAQIEHAGNCKLPHRIEEVDRA